MGGGGGVFSVGSREMGALMREGPRKIGEFLRGHVLI